MQLAKVLLVLACGCVLGGCATYDWSFNKAQLYLDNYRHAQLKIDQGQLP